MSKKYLRLITHGVAKLEPNNISSSFEGLWVHTPASGGILIIAKSQNKLVCLFTLLSNNTDYIAKHLAWMDSPYDLQFVRKTAGNLTLEQKLLSAFLTRLKKSLADLHIPLYSSYSSKVLNSPVTGINFTGSLIEIHEKERLQSTAFESARLAINTFNHLGAYEPKGKFADYELDVQFDGSLDPTPLPKLSYQGYFLWDILKDINYQSLLLANPYINETVKDLILNPYEGMPFRNYLKMYDDFLEIIKTNATNYTNRCIEAFKEENFAEANLYAEEALKNLLKLNIQHNKSELAIVYYNLGSALLKQGKLTEAASFLKEAKELNIKLGNIEKLSKINEKLAATKKTSAPTTSTFFDLPQGVIVKIIRYLKPPDIAHFANASKKTRAIALEPYLWKKKLSDDFTKEILPETEKSYLTQYQEKYSRIPRDISQLNKTQQLNLAFKIGAEVWVEKLLRGGAVLNHHIDMVKSLFESNNKRLINSMLTKYLDVNKAISNNFVAPISIFHLAAFVAPELLPLLLNATAELTILPKLHAAVLQNNMQYIQALPVNSPDVDAKDICDCTALWWALLLNNREAASQLIAKGASIDNVKKSGHVLKLMSYDIFDILVRENYVSCLELLLENRLSANTFSGVTGSPLLVIAARYGKTDILQLLLKFGATANYSLDDTQLAGLHANFFIFEPRLCFSPIGAAAANNHVNCLDILIKLTDVNYPSIIYSSKDHKHHSINRYPPLIVAIEELADQAVEFLLTKGADPNQTGTCSIYEHDCHLFDRVRTCLDTLLKTGSSKLENDFIHPGYHPKSENAKESQRWLKILELLLKFGVNVNHAEAENPFIISLIKNPIYITKVKKEDGGICYWNEAADDSYQQLFLLEALRILSHYKVDFSQQDNEGKTICHHAANRGYLEVIRYLTEEIKLDINIKDNQGETAIFLAAKALHEDIFKYLKKMSGNLDDPNLEGETPNQLISASFMKRLSL